MPPPTQRALAFESITFDEFFDVAINQGLLSEASFDAMTDALARGSTTEAALQAEWTSRVSTAVKDAGNAAFKAKDYARAAEAYLLAIRCDPENRSACSNLALMHLKLGEPDQAVLAANTALLLSSHDDPDVVYRKARYRRGLAFEALGKLDYALVDLEDSRGAGNNNNNVADDLKRVKAKLLAERAAQRRAQGDAAAAESSGSGEHAKRGKVEKTPTEGGADAACGDEEDEEDLISEVIDINDRRLRRQQGDAVVGTLPRIDVGPLAELSREEQKAQMCGLGEFLITHYYGLGELLTTHYYAPGAASSPMRWTLPSAARFGRRCGWAGLCA